MSTIIQVTGPPSSGKTFSLKSLVEKYPNCLYVINADNKPLA